ncbi:hypothetical protein Q2T40_18700 [Winogradskyella maritima]|uniref:Uncharacterized protein n=1 Tax=Winogradskyella maritima TaxID=1517766 RepID=A0ABV8ADP3_9FLAO|nr:hypothetical protein [Winogradskyella maritima]
MSNFKTIQSKLEQFIRKFYVNELLKGVILFFAIGLLYLIFTLLIEYFLWLGPTLRTILFWTFIAVELGLFIRFIAFPLLKLFNLREGINNEKASQIIGGHFPQVNDKLLNVLQLNQSKRQSDLLLASIEQKSQELSPVPFQMAVNFKSNIKYLKYAAIPVAIILLSFVSGKIDWFSDSYERVVNYKTAYEPPAPFLFFVLNDNLQAIENKDFRLLAKTAGTVIPENAMIQFNDQNFYLQQIVQGEFQYVFERPSEAITFSLTANGITSKEYTLEVTDVPTLLSFDMVLDYPSHTRKIDETLKSSGSATIPEGTKVRWEVNTKSTTDVRIYAEDTIGFQTEDQAKYTASKRIYKNYNYNLATSNSNLKDYENLAFSLNVVKDAYPELDLKMQKDSLDNQSLYFYGQASDDYGISKVNLVYYPVGKEDQRVVEPITTSKFTFVEFVSAFPDQLNLKDGVSYELYFEVFDNDAVHNYKRIKSSVFGYRKLTQEETEEKQLQEQNETIEGINETFEKLQEQDKNLQELSKTQKEKEALNFNDKKKFEDFLKRQKQQEQLMKNFNKKLQENLEEFQNEKEEKDQFKEDLKERLKDNEEQLKKDEKLLEELEKLRDKISKEEFSQKLEELAKQNKNKKRSMEQLLELTKRFYVTKKAEKITNQLEELAKEQEELSKKKGDENTEKQQEELNKKFEDIQKAIEELKSENRKLRKPLDVPSDKSLEESIKKDQKEAKESLKEKQEKQNSPEPEEQQEGQKQEQNAQQKQQNASKKMKQMSQEFKKMMESGGGGGGGSQMQEDAEMLRQILDNLIRFSFDQEGLMDQFKDIDIGHNQFGKFVIRQNTLREHFEHIDDSLFALSLRNPKLSENVNKQITEVYFNIDKALEQLAENRLYQGTAAQQYTITATNELADFLSNTLDNMEMSMNMQPGQRGEGDMQLPDIIMTQEELNKKMEEAVKKSQEGQEGEEGEKPGEKPGEQPGEMPGEKGKEGKEGEQGEKGQQGKDGQNGQQGQNGKQQGEGQSGQQNGEGNGEGEGDGKDGKQDGKDGEKNGYGEGGNEELNGELYKIYQQQQQLRQALQDKIGKEGSKGNVGDLIQKMEEVELDLINQGFTNQTLQKMMDLQHQLLKLNEANFTQGQDDKRESKTNRKNYNSTNGSQIPTAKSYFNTTEILNRQALPLRERYKKKVQDYFKKKDD